MFVEFFYELRDMKIPVTIREYLMLLEALDKNVCDANVDDFYFLSRAALVKDERNFDRFDQAFGTFFRGLERRSAEFFDDAIPDSWLRAVTQRMFSEEELKKLEKLGFEELMEELQKRLEEQDKPHSGGNKWIGTGGTSPFGHSGRNPAGIRIGGEGGGGSATKVWKKREFRNLTGEVEIGTRNIKIALRRLRKFAREGAADEFDLDETISSTARNAGLLDVKMRPERRNRRAGRAPVRRLEGQTAPRRPGCQVTTRAPRMTRAPASAEAPRELASWATKRHYAFQNRSRSDTVGPVRLRR